MTTRRFRPNPEGAADYLFPEDVWIAAQRDLVVAEDLIQEFGRRYKMKFFRNIDVHWPARGLTKRTGFVFYQLILSLNANFLQDEKIYYELSDHTETDIRVWSWLRDFRPIAQYSPEQIQDRDLLARDIEAALSSRSA